LTQEVSKRNEYSQISSLFSELEKLKEESKVLKEIEKYQKEQKAKKEENNFYAINSTQSNLKSSIYENDSLIRTDKDGYTLINNNSGNFYGNVFCFP
jgi:hypothetical protein